MQPDVKSRAGKAAVAEHSPGPEAPGAAAVSPRGQLDVHRPSWVARLVRDPQYVTYLGVVLLAIVLALVFGKEKMAQLTVFGLAEGALFSLGAVGLTLVFGVLNLVNFAHGELITFAAYMTIIFNVALGFPLVFAALISMALTAVFALTTELAIWKPMRKVGAGMFQTMLMSIGLMFVVRYVIQMVSGTKIRQFNVDPAATYSILGLHVGESQAWTIIIGLPALVAIGLLLKFTSIGKQMRAISDDRSLAEIAGINTAATIRYMWILAGAAAGITGVLGGWLLSTWPELGFKLLLPIFAVVVLGGAGNAFGALAGGLLLGLMIEWSTLIIPYSYKMVVGFVVLIIVMVIRPTGVLATAKVK
jgi:neutral amino acid transport system permease protein